jgi:hypothetical protein
VALGGVELAVFIAFSRPLAVSFRRTLYLFVSLQSYDLFFEQKARSCTSVYINIVFVR